jgi:hypothetical protein
MTLQLKLFTALWLAMIFRGVGALLGGRHALRLRHETKYRQIYEWFTAIGVGLVLWGIVDIGLIWRSIVNDFARCSEYSPDILWYSIFLNLLSAIAVWTITLAILDGRAPGALRGAIFWLLTKSKIMDSDKKFSSRSKVMESSPDLPITNTKDKEK